MTEAACDLPVICLATSRCVVHGYLRVATSSSREFMWASRLVQIGDSVVV